MSVSNGFPDEPRNGRIITFYSYKGGTGRSMSLANVGWILATNGYRVLLIDWDLEAPGLHRWFGPLLDDPELQHARGVIDFFHQFMEGSRLEQLRREQHGKPDDRWFEHYTDLAGFAVGIDFEFPAQGLLNLVPAGRQSPDYAMLVQMFDWGAFYKDLGGGIFLEAVKQKLREEYDFILIDSRTGISDTSGICTVQMPDDLVVCFTLNRQSILGARDICAAADQQRRRPDGSPGLRIWPVPTRVELGEKDRLDKARQLMRSMFAGVNWQLNREQRKDYWSTIEILYVPYYACEETLATLADPPGMSNTLLHSMEILAGRLVNQNVLRCRMDDEPLRLATLQRYAGPPAVDAAEASQRSVRAVVLYSQDDVPSEVIASAVAVVEEQFPELSVWWDGLLPFGLRWNIIWEEKLETCDLALVFWGPSWERNSWSEAWPLGEYAETLAMQEATAVIPIVCNGATFRDLPQYLQDRAGIKLGRLRSHWSDNFLIEAADFDGPALGAVLCRMLQKVLKAYPLLRTNSTSARPVDPEDPHLGRFGGLAQRNGLALTAEVSAIPDNTDWWEIRLTVTANPNSAIHGDVIFHLHPTFPESVMKVPLRDGRAELIIQAWGAFTVGVELDEGRRRLELNLAELPGVPKEFAER